jgi:molecular chaperone DnaJ
MVQAALGSKVKVRTIHGGQRAMVNIPPGTQTGTRFRLAGLGVDRGGRKGHQYVIVKVNTPTDLSDRERQILEEFAKERKQRKKPM